MTTNPSYVEERSMRAAKLYREERYEDAFHAYLSLAEQGYVASQRFVGWLYFRGEGVQRDKTQALLWLEKAAEGGDAEAAFGVGRVLMSDQRFGDAYKWYEMAGQQGYLPAMYWTARFLQNGWGVNEDKRLALSTYAEAAQLGHIQSMRNYARMLLSGYGGPIGIFKGVLWFARFLIDVFRIGIWDLSDPRAVV